jgi:4-hydroxyacetophenone monooxygenase
MADDQNLAAAIEIANIPTLLMVLVQMTGDMRWMEPPYRPARAGGMGDNDTGGLPPQAQAEVRSAALEAIEAWQAGAPVAIPEPSPALLVDMLSCAMGESVPAEYGRMTGAQLGLPSFEPTDATRPFDVPDGFRALIIGAGVSGMCAAVSLQRAGIAFTILEQHDTVGGVWLENQYPGAGVDTPNHLYSYSFAPYDWSQYFALRGELHAYLEHVADQFDLRRHVQFGTKVESANYDADAQQWSVDVRRADGTPETLRTDVLFSSIGIFNPLKMPQIDGLDSFAGPSFHTAQWRHDVDLTGKRVAIIGNGASAMQVAPEIQPIVESLTIFQRSPQWAAPFEHFRKSVPDPLRHLLREVPLYRAWYRVRLGWTFNDRVHPALQRDPAWPHPERSMNAINDAHREFFTRYIHAQVGDRTDLLEQIVPTYPPFGKRMLMDNGWYRMLTNDNVELVTDPIDHIEADRVVLRDGSEFAADVLVIATGFDVLRFLSTFEITGRSGVSLRDTWEDDNAKAYLGLAVPDFPNFFMLYGPNTQPGHGGSLIFVIEMQLRYIMDLLGQMFEQGVGVVECRQDVHDEYNSMVDAAHDNMVWSHPGMETYYRNSRGRVVVNMPYRNVDMFERTSHADLDDFITEPRRS